MTTTLKAEELEKNPSYEILNNKQTQKLKTLFKEE